MFNASKFHELRQASGFSQAAFGHLVGVSLHSIFRLEKGERQPKADELEKIAHALGITTDEIAYLGDSQNDIFASLFPTSPFLPFSTATAITSVLPSRSMRNPLPR